MSRDNLRFACEFNLENLARTLEFGRLLAHGIDSPGVMALYGGLGSGKTTLVQALGEGLEVEGPVTSPTYTIINRYEGGRLPLVHVDCYRIRDPEELYDIGLPEWLDGPQVVCIEWSELAGGLLPPGRLELELAWLAPERRGVKLGMYGGLWPGLDSLIAAWLERSVTG